MSGLTETSPGTGIRNRHKQLEQDPEHCVSSPLLWRPEKAQTAVSVPVGPRHLATYPVPIHGLSKLIKPPPTRCFCGSTVGKDHAPEKTAITAQGMAGKLETPLWQQLADLKGLSPSHYPAGLMGWETKKDPEWKMNKTDVLCSPRWKLSPISIWPQKGIKRKLACPHISTQWVYLPVAFPCNISLAGD